MTDLNAIRIFTQVVSQGSFTAAAKQLGFTKTTVSRKLAALEERLGVRLLTRSTRHLHLTEQGEVFFQRCKRVLSDLAEAELAVCSAQEKVTGHLNLVVPIEVGQLVMARVIGEYLQHYPDVSINAELTNRKVDMLAEGVDLMFQLGRGKNSSLISRRVISSHTLVVASPSYIENHGMPETPADLEQHNCIVGQLHNWTFFKDGIEKTIKPHGVFVTNNITCVREAAVSGLGVAWLPMFLIKSELNNAKLVPLVGDWQSIDSHIYALYPERRYMPQNLKTFLEFSYQQLAEAWK